MKASRIFMNDIILIYIYVYFCTCIKLIMFLLICQSRFYGNGSRKEVDAIWLTRYFAKINEKSVILMKEIYFLRKKEWPVVRLK